MAAPLKHILQQGPVIAGLLKVGWSALTGSSGGSGPPQLPAPAEGRRLDPRPRSLVDDYLRWLGASPKRYAGAVPPHLFPQWGFPVLSEVLDDIPYPLPKVLNQGCRVTVNGRLPDDQPLCVSGQLVDISEEPGKARIHQRLTTGTDDEPELVVADVYAVVPLPRDKTDGDRKKKKRGRPSVPSDATERAERRFGPRAGRDFAVLTGDFNPIHWIPPAARLAGFDNCILHGFATLGWAWEALVDCHCAGDPDAVHQVDVRFTRPLVLPTTARLYTRPAQDQPDEGRALEIAVGAAPSAPAWMLGSARLR